MRGFSPDRNPAADTGQWTVSVNGGDKPRWSRDGKELFYIATDGKMMAVPIRGGSGIRAGGGDSPLRQARYRIDALRRRR